MSASHLTALIFASTEELHGELGEYQCYYCDNFNKTKKKNEYDSHVESEHPGMPPYPDKPDMEKFGLKPQGKSWERLHERQSNKANVKNEKYDDKS